MKNIKENKVSIGTFLKPHKLGVGMYILFSILASTATVFVTLSLANAIEEVTLLNFESAITWLLITLAITVARRLMWTAMNFIYFHVSRKIMTELNYSLSKQSFKLNSTTYTNHDTGGFVQRIIYDPKKVVSNLSDCVDMITEILSSLAVLIYIATLNWIIGLVVFSVVAICIVFEFIRSRKLRKNRKILNRMDEKITSLTTQIVNSEKDIKALNLEGKLSQVVRDEYSSYRKADLKLSYTDMGFWTFRNGFLEIANLALLILGVALIDKSLITFATFMIVYANNGRLIELIFSVGNIWTRFTEVKIACERMFQLYDNKEFVCERFGDKTLENPQGQIEFKNVSYSYIDYENPSDLEVKDKKKKRKDKKPEKVVTKSKVFENINFTIPSNKTVAFVGKSGSGKSTILNLISKMYEVDSGEVLIDGVNINDLTKESLRNTISLVNQFPYIFDMTIKENMLLAKQDATDEEIIEALKQASFYEFVETLKNGIDTRVGESGVKLSGGQRQRLAIARAMLRKSSILIFDESTSALDNFAQGNIKHSIDKLKGKSTMIIVAHRLSTIKDADIIFYLDKGEIVDKGTFEELFTNNAKFREMYLAENIED